jgi:hypothetical protein
MYVWGLEGVVPCQLCDTLLFVRDKELTKQAKDQKIKITLQMPQNLTQGRKRANQDIIANGGTTLKNESTLNLNSTNATTAESSKFSCGVLKSIKESSITRKKTARVSPNKVIQTNFGRYQMPLSPKGAQTSRAIGTHHHCMSTINTLLKEMRRSPNLKNINR